jgi:hypothetical protein
MFGCSPNFFKSKNTVYAVWDFDFQKVQHCSTVPSTNSNQLEGEFIGQ